VPSLPRVLLDLAASGHTRRLEDAIDRAKRHGDLHLDEIDAMLARRGPVAGAGLLRESLQLYRLPVFDRARSELLFLAMVEKEGLPRPATNIFAAGAWPLTKTHLSPVCGDKCVRVSRGRRRARPGSSAESSRRESSSPRTIPLDLCGGAGSATLTVGGANRGGDMSNVDTARSAYEAFGRGDLDALRDTFAEDAAWVTSDELPLGGEVRGRDQILSNFAQIPSYWSSFSVEPEEFIDAGDYVIVRGTQRAANDRGSLEAPFVHVLEYDGNGKTVRGEFFADSAKAAKLLA
jgi:uncharacterized protein